jgi:hypothetical protein
LECIRERNRVAARKYRQKQKDRSSQLEEHGEKLIQERDKLANKVKKLQAEVLILKQKSMGSQCWNCGSAQ